MTVDTACMIVKLTFDGGTRPTNPGRGYGSYHFTDETGILSGKGDRLEFGDWITSNQAEYMALLAGLRHLLTEVGLACVSPTELQVNIYGDSKLVINQVKGSWRCKNPTLLLLNHQVITLLDEFGKFNPIWHCREKSVAMFGH